MVGVNPVIIPKSVDDSCDGSALEISVRQPIHANDDSINYTGIGMLNIWQSIFAVAVDDPSIFNTFSLSCKYFHDILNTDDEFNRKIFNRFSMDKYGFSANNKAELNDHHIMKKMIFSGTKNKCIKKINRDEFKEKIKEASMFIPTKDLIIENNYRVPVTIKYLVKLSDLFLSNLNITYLPDVFHDLKLLVTIDVSKNPKLNQLPKSFKCLVNLRSVNIRGCSFKKVPMVLNNLKNIKTIEFR